MPEAAGPATADLAEAQIDLDRRRRCGYPEVVFGQGKIGRHAGKDLHAPAGRGASTCWPRGFHAEQAAELVPKFPTARYNAVGRTFRIALIGSNGAAGKRRGHVAIVTAGTSDLPVAEEARETLLWMGVDGDDDLRRRRGRAASPARASGRIRPRPTPSS